MRKGILKNESNFHIQDYIETRASSNFRLRTLTCSLFYLFKGVLRYKRAHHGHCSPVLCRSWHWIDVFCSSRWVLLLFCILYLLWPYHTLGTKGFFFSSATFAVRFWSASKPTHLRPEPRPRVAKPRENDDRLFERIYPDFCACFSVFKTWPKAQTAQEKPLVVLSQERVALSSKSLFNFLCQSQILKWKSYLQTSLIVY